MIMIDLLNRIDEGNNFIIDEKRAIELIIRYIKTNALEPYVQYIYFDDEHSNAPVLYDSANKAIILNSIAIKNGSNIIKDQFFTKYKLSDEWKDYFINYGYLYYLLYVINLVNQEKRYQMGTKEDVFAYLHDIEAQGDVRRFLPMHLLASNQALYDTYQLFYSTRLPIKKTKLLYLEYLQTLLQYYTETSEGIKAPFDRLNLQDEKYMKMIESIQNIPFSERIKMGLWVTPSELDNKKQKVKKFKRNIMDMQKKRIK